jgi:hypothetical protein
MPYLRWQRPFWLTSSLRACAKVLPGPFQIFLCLFFPQTVSGDLLAFLEADRSIQIFSHCLVVVLVKVADNATEASFDGRRSEKLLPLFSIACVSVCTTVKSSLWAISFASQQMDQSPYFSWSLLFVCLPDFCLNLLLSFSVMLSLFASKLLVQGLQLVVDVRNLHSCLVELHSQSFFPSI